MNTESITATIQSSGAVEISLPGGMNKSISIADYLTVIKSIASSADTIEAGISMVMPDNVHSVTSDSRGFIVCIYSTETSREVTHSSWGTHTISTPNVLLRIRLNKVNGQENAFSIGDIRWYTSDLSRSSLPTVFPERPNVHERIWSLPMPNMYDNGNMCLGSNSLPSILYTDWTILSSLIEDTLWRSTFNNDLRIHNVSNYEGLHEWLTTLRSAHTDGTGFPYNRLQGAS